MNESQNYIYPSEKIGAKIIVVKVADEDAISLYVKKIGLY